MAKDWTWGEEGAGIWAPVGGHERRIASLPVAAFAEPGVKPVEVAREERLAAARLIVRAVNAHSALMDALEKVNAMACYASEENPEARADMLLRIGETARAALKKAEASR